MKKALLIVAIPTHFREMFRVARLLRGSGRYAPLVFFTAPYTGWDRDARFCADEGIAWHALFSSTFRKAWIVSTGSGRKEITEAVPLLPAALDSDQGVIGKLPLRARAPMRRAWRSVYRAYWHVNLRLTSVLAYIPTRFWWGMVILRRVWSLMRRGVNSGHKSIILAAFGELWDADTLPHTLLGKKNLHKALPEFFRAQKVALLVLPEDNHFLDTHFYVRAAKLSSAASVIIPFTIANSLEWAETFRGRYTQRLWWPPNFLMARAFPHWVFEHKGVKMIMPWVQILMCEHLGLTPPHPWLINSGYADKLLVEAPFLAEYYRKAGIEPARIELTGGLAEDELHAQLARAAGARERLYAELNMPPGRPMLLISVPPNQLVGDGRAECEFSSYATMMKTVLAILCACEGWNVVLNLHPRVLHGDLAAAGPHCGQISSAAIASLIPLCDLFVASASTTIRLACAAGKPVVNYDVYRYGYSDFMGIAGVRTVSDLAAFREAIASLTSDAGLRGELARLQEAFAAQHALVDGRSGERMLALFDRLTR